MKELFLNIFTVVSVEAGLLIIAVILLRALFQRAPKWIACFLWLLVGIKLTCPYSVESPFSLIPSEIYAWSETIGENGLQGNNSTSGADKSGKNISGSTGFYKENSSVGGGRFDKKNDSFSDAKNPIGDNGSGMVNNDIKENSLYGAENSDSSDSTKDHNKIKNFLTENFIMLGTSLRKFAKANLSILTGIWIFGMLAMLPYLLASFVYVRRKLRMATLLRDNVYECEFVDSPFVLGIISPKIYIPYHMEPKNLNHVLAHENAHIKRGDHIFKLAAFLVLSVYWFHPFVWLSYVLFNRDVEVACDEKVIKSMEDEEKKGYLVALLECSTNRPKSYVCPLSFGEIGIKERVSRVKKFKKFPKWGIVLVIIVCAAIAVGFLTKPELDVVAKDEIVLADESEDEVWPVDETKGEIQSTDGTGGNIQPAEKESGDVMTIDGQDTGVKPEGSFGLSEKTVATEEASINLSPYYHSRIMRSKNGKMVPPANLALDTEVKRFSFGYDAFSSYLSMGTYRIRDEKLICTTDDKKYTYVFDIFRMQNNRVFSLSFDKDSSYYLEGTEFELKDGMRLEPGDKLYLRQFIEVKEVPVEILDFSQDAGADGISLYYADDKKIIFGGDFGLFVYDREQEKIIRSLDREYIGCDMTQGDYYCTVAANLYGTEVYLQKMGELYAYDTEANVLSRFEYGFNLREDDYYPLFSIEYNNDPEATSSITNWQTRAVYEKDGEERYVALYRNGFGTIGECAYVDWKMGESFAEAEPIPLFP